MKAKEILAKIRAAFAEPAAAPVTTDPVTTSTDKTYKTADGTEIVIKQAGDVPAIGDTVTIAGVPAPEGTLTLEDESTVAVDATGVITAYTPKEPVTATTVPAAIAPVAPVPLAAVEHTPEEFAAMFAAFATGTPEERIANLEKVAKALMESCFGWQLREAEQKAAADQAIAIYKQGLVTAEATMAEQKLQIEKYGKTITDLFELTEKLVELPTADPVTLTANKKEKFERASKREDAIKGIADAITAMKKSKA